MKKVRTLVKYAREVARKAKKKGKPIARKILAESIKLERMLEQEAKKALSGKRKKVKRRKTTKKKTRRKRKR